MAERNGLGKYLRWTLISVGFIGIVGAVAAALYVTAITLEQAQRRVSQTTLPGEHVVVGLDISQGSPLIADERFDRVAGEFLGERIRDMSIRSLVTVASIGDFGRRQEALNFRREITLRDPATKVARTVETVVAGLPRSIETGMIVPHERTNILGVLEDLAQTHECDPRDPEEIAAAAEAGTEPAEIYRKTTFYLFTDGIEDSEFVVLDSVDKHLPDARPGLFKNCEALYMIGIGRSQPNPVMTNHLRTEWERWARQAGFKDFKGIVTLR